MMATKQVQTNYGTIRYPWGDVVKVHELAGSDGYVYLIVEDDRPEFHPYIVIPNKGIKDTSHGYHSIEEAITGVIAHRYDGLNTQAGYFFHRMIGKETDKQWLEEWLV